MSYMPPTLETSRLLLRPLQTSDAATLLTIWSDPIVTQFLNIAPFSTIAEAEAMITLLSEMAARQQAVRWSIIAKEEQRIIGSAGFNSWLKEDAYRGEIGYELAQSHWNRGLMTEALQALFNYAFTAMGLNRIEALVEPGNTPSLQLLKKLGFSHEGLLRNYQFSKGRFIDLVMLSLLKADWNSRF